MVYSNPKLSTRELPENSPSDVAFESYINGKQESSFTQADIVNASNDLWSNHFSKFAGVNPIFMSLNLETPLALATFVASNSNLQKVYIPATFNMNKLLHSLKT